MIYSQYFRVEDTVIYEELRPVGDGSYYMHTEKFELTYITEVPEIVPPLFSPEWREQQNELHRC